MDNNRLLLLLNKYQDNACTDLELQELEQWYSSMNTGRKILTLTEETAEEMLKQFRQRLASQPRFVTFYRKKFFRIAAAASIATLLGFGGWFLYQHQKSSIQHVDSPLATLDFTSPTSTKAYITLSDNRKVYLEDLQNGIVATDAGITINKEGDKIIYEESRLTVTDSRMNTLSVPKGSKPVKLLLADNSEMWLDAATTVAYPSTFVGKERRVEIITGQVYFEVSHDPLMPFKVKMGDAEVIVLGTQFNISAFEHEELKVTLLEGSVKVSDGDESVTIKPGQQTRRIANQKLHITSSVDPEEVMAWKNGNFQFEGADINAVMKQIARWYDVEVEVKGNIKEHFGGTISRDVNVSKVFEMLRLTGEVNYKIDGRKIIVSP